MKQATPTDTFDHMMGSGAIQWSWWTNLKWNVAPDPGSTNVPDNWECVLTCEDGNYESKSAVINHKEVMKAARFVMSNDIRFMSVITKQECRNLIFDRDEVDFDAGTADELLQYMVLGEVVFG